MPVETHHRIEPIAAEWDDLVDRAGGSPFLRPGWMDAWWRAFGEGGLEILALRRKERLAGVVPLARKNGALRSPTNWHTPEFALLAQDDGARRQLAAHLLSVRPRRLSLAFLNADDPDAATCEEAARSAGYRLLARTLERSPYVEIKGDWAAYERSLDAHRLSEMRRRRRRLEEQGRLTFTIETGRERLDELLEEGFDVEGSGWKAESGTAILSRPETRVFYTEVARWAVERGTLRLAFLRLDGRPIAFFYLVSDGGVLYHLKGGYDASYGKYAPGMLITYELLAHAFAEGMKSYEFLGDEEPFKLAWTDKVRERILLQAFARSATGTLDWAAFSYGRPLAKRLLASVRR